MEPKTIIDIVLVFTLIEAALLIGLRLIWRRGPNLRVLASMLLPGLFVMLAMRALAYDQHWLWIVHWMNLALVAHLFDLKGRWQNHTRSQQRENS